MGCSPLQKFLVCLLVASAFVCGLVLAPLLLDGFTERAAPAELLDPGAALPQPAEEAVAPEPLPPGSRAALRAGAAVVGREQPVQAEAEPERPLEGDGAASQPGAPEQLARKGSHSEDRYQEGDDREAPRGRPIPTLPPEGLGPGATARILEEIDKQSRSISAKCDSWYGYAMLKDQRKAILEVCKPESEEGSHVYCLERKPFDEPRYLCVAENVEMVSHENGKPDHGLRLGVAGCERKLDSQKLPNFSWYEQPTMQKLVSRPSLACRHVVEHPVILYKFWESPNFKNLYEALADFVNVFEAALTLRWEFNDLEVMATNLKENTTFYPIFESIRRLYGGRGIRYSTQWYKNGTCFRSIVLPPSPGLCSLSANGGRKGQTECRAPVVAAAASAIRGLFPETRSQPRLAPNCLLTMMHRGSGKRSMDSSAVAAEVGRLLQQRPALEKYSPVVFDPVGKPLYEGLAAMASTAVLFGIHGAGLSHTLFLEPGTALLELFCGDRKPSNGHYKTIAAMVGASYASMRVANCAKYTAAAVAAQVLEIIPTHSELSCLR